MTTNKRINATTAKQEQEPKQSQGDSESDANSAPAPLGLLGPAHEAPLPALEEQYALAIIFQLMNTQTAPSNVSEPIQLGIKRGSIAHYQAIEPQDGLESALARAVVGLNNGMMDCFGRAARNAAFPDVREIELRLGIKAALALADVVKALDNHRGRDRPKVAVGQLNVQAGGQAVLANLERHEHADRASECPSAIQFDQAHDSEG